MTGKALGQIAGILSSYDFSTFKTVADIGGGRGHLLQAVLGAAPNATGVLFDQPHVVEDMAGAASARFTLQGGDFFKDALPVCDAYLIMQVIHDWNDRPSRRDPERHSTGSPRARQTLAHRGDYSRRLEPQLDQNARSSSCWRCCTGKERTRREFEGLLAASGFRLDRVIDVGLGTSILDASVI